MYDLVSLGEVMLRLSPPNRERLRQAKSFTVRVCGAQFNVAADLALLGRKTAFVSKLPANELGWLTLNVCTGYGVDMSHVQFVGHTRMGTIYVEFGAEPRSSLHLYDRQGSAASTIAPGDFDWAPILRDARLAYTDGVFLGLTENCREAVHDFIQASKRERCQLCFDMNYRETLWGPEEAKKSYSRILPSVDVLVTNRSVSEMLFGTGGSDAEILWRYRNGFGCRTICLTSRAMVGTFRGSWHSIALHGDEIIESGPFEFENVDRFGTGDAFFAGFLDGYLEGDVGSALQFGNALCALAHTIEGDVAATSRQEVLELLKGGHYLYVKR